MDHRFKTGDQIRVRCVPGSPWQGMYGTILEVIARPENESLQEYAVGIGGDRRWFLPQHLIRTVPPKLIRFFRNEVLERWKLDPDQIAFLNGDRDQLIELLRDHYDFASRRAEAEVDDFYADFEKRIEQATEASNIGLSKSPTAA